jgi:hypothetical protein
LIDVADDGVFDGDCCASSGAEAQTAMAASSGSMLRNMGRL